MAFKEFTYTVGQKLTSTVLNNNYSNFAEIAKTPETEGQVSTDPFFVGRAVKTAYFHGLGHNLKIFSENISSFTYPSVGTYQINYAVNYQTARHCITFAGVKDGVAEGRNFQFGCQSQTSSQSTIYWRASDSGNTDVAQCKFGVFMGYPSNGV